MQPASTPVPEITGKSFAMIALLGLIWGATFLVIELALEGITPAWLAAYRIGFASLLTAAIWQALGGRLFLTEARPWPILGIVGVFNSALPFLLLSWGQVRVTSGFAGVSMAAVALIVLPLAHIFLPGERMTLRRTLGFLTGFVGVVILIGPSAFAATGDPLEPLGRLACLGAAGCYASASVIMRRLPPMDPIGLAAVPLLAGCAAIIPFAWVVEGPPPLPQGETLFWLALLGLVPTAGANLLRVLVIRTAGPVFMSLVNYQVPVWSVCLGIVFLNEPAGLSLVVALVLILSGVFVSQWGKLSRLFRAAR
ncbi:putative DMT superfamily transporter inner membrane protein [Roseivivax sp. THAF40]|uniref:DMT family transporter n=1 Tax=unclassified Roseivivax TaxID=2639302 RepID=UPI0012AA9866|nr:MULTISPECIES: DMT family transporter [unclassified Roseivivax]QFS83276.1 putative DMT superfamily transporter inner membrane protein [Roseivivax sp. THAF197b]QFT47020.1 putative DMT superfamily transporter inner membrane protein [Roseivivax sp. THAF40]